MIYSNVFYYQLKSKLKTFDKCKIYYYVVCILWIFNKDAFYSCFIYFKTRSFKKGD